MLPTRRRPMTFWGWTGNSLASLRCKPFAPHGRRSESSGSHSDGCVLNARLLGVLSLSFLCARSLSLDERGTYELNQDTNPLPPGGSVFRAPDRCDRMFKNRHN